LFFNGTRQVTVHNGPVLLTGFEAFDGATSNPSREAVALLHGKQIEGRRIIGACLPVSFKRGPQELRKLLRKYDPAMVLCVGLAASRSHLSLERVAVNLADARIADNDGEQPLDAPIVKHAPAAYFSSVPVKAMVSRLRGRGFKAEVSYSAGTYVCNAVFYALMHALRRRPGACGGFIHVPPVHSSQAGAALTGRPRSVQEIASGLRVCISVGLKVQRDVPLSMGFED
jgi:pyroglutamyl-peptidase